jgi:hypothetical protein
MARTARKTENQELFTPNAELSDKLDGVRKLLDDIAARTRDGATGGDNDDAAATVTVPVTPRQPRRTRAMETTMNAPTHAALPNVPTFDNYLAKAEEYAEAAAKGQNAGHAFLVELLTGGYLGALTYAPREGEQEGDHAKLAARYATKQGLMNKANPKASNQKKLKSDFGLAIKTGNNPKFGTGQPLAATNDFLATLDALRRKQVKGLRDTYNGLLNFWRHCNKAGKVPANAKELEVFCYVPDSKAVTVDSALENVRKTLAKISQGKLANCSETDDSKEVKDAVALITKRLAARAKVRGQTGQAPATPVGAAVAA